MRRSGRSGWSSGWCVGVVVGLGLGGCGDEAAAPSDTALAADADASDVTGGDTILLADAAEVGADAVVDPDSAPEVLPDVAAEDVDDVAPEVADEVAAEVSDDVAAEVAPEVADDAATEVADDVAAPSVPLPGFGAISGDCGFLDDELTSSSPSFFVNHLDFASNGWDSATELTLLTDGAQEMWADGNAGGSSVESEIFAFEVLDRCELATLVKSETEVLYDPPGSKKTDILVAIDGMKVGVSVTRAVGFPFDAPYTVAQATDILTKKLNGIIESTDNVVEGDRWVKQILHVMAYAEPHVTSLRTAWDALTPTLRGDTIIIVTVTDGDDAVIY